MITMTVFVKVKPEKQEEFLQAMCSFKKDQGIQEGLRKSILFKETDDQNGYSLIYEWETQEDCERYLGAEKFRVLLGALKVLCENSEIRCGHISEKLTGLAFGT